MELELVDLRGPTGLVSDESCRLPPARVPRLCRCGRLKRRAPLPPPPAITPLLARCPAPGWTRPGRLSAPPIRVGDALGALAIARGTAGIGSARPANAGATYAVIHTCRESSLAL